MVNRISTSISSQLSPFTAQAGGSLAPSKNAKPVSQQVQDVLFGKKKPQILGLQEHSDLKELLVLLDRYRRKFAAMAGDPENFYKLQLASGTIAMIDEEGTIFLGVSFLRNFKHLREVLIGVLAHEIGHRPKRWQQYKEKRELAQEELKELCRYEETRADWFCGRALAEVGMSPQPLIQFLEKIEEGPHPEYFPVRLRAEVIRQAWGEQKSLVQMRRKLWPQLERASSPYWHIGEF